MKMMKRNILITCIVLLVSITINTVSSGNNIKAAGNTDIKIMINGRYVDAEKQETYLLTDNTLMISLQSLKDIFNVDFDGTCRSKEINLSVPKEGRATIYPKAASAVINGKLVMMDSAVIIREGKVYIPLNFMIDWFCVGEYLAGQGKKDILTKTAFTDSTKMIIDRFEGRFAVCEGNQGKMYNIKRELLPDDMEAGDHFYIRQGKVT